MTGLREQTAAAIREHREVISGPMRDSSCSCKGWGQGQGWEGRDSGDWAEHVADAVLALLTEEWAQAPAFAPDAPYMETHRSHPHPPPPKFLGPKPPPSLVEVVRWVSGWSVVAGEPT